MSLLQILLNVLKRLQELTTLIYQRYPSWWIVNMVLQQTFGKRFLKNWLFLIILFYTIILIQFGNIETNPTKIPSLDSLKILQKEKNALIATANDPDGDRFICLDEDGNALLPETITTIIAHYLVKKERPLTGITTTLASSRLCKVATKKLGLTFNETAVGFKYFAPYFEEAKKHNTLELAVESSGGFSTSWHTFEKCGFIPALLLAAIIIDTGKTTSELKKEIDSTFGTTIFLEDEYHYPAEKKQDLNTFFTQCSKENLDQSFTDSIDSINSVDGLKIVFTNQDWLLFRLSGTEPLARIYCESEDKETAEQLIETGKKLLTSI